jgi:hypothetical protein
MFRQFVARSISIATAALLGAAPIVDGAQPEPRILIRGGWLFDGVRDSVVPNPGIIVVRGKILTVGADPAARERRGSSEPRDIELEDDD